MTSVLIDERTCGTLQIPDADGEVHSYSIDLAPEGLDDVAFVITRLDGEGESPYRVARTMTGSWRCACPDAVYRARKLKRACKHVQHVAPLWIWIERLTSHARRSQDPEEARP